MAIPGDQALVAEMVMTLTGTHSKLDKIRGMDNLVEDCLLVKVLNDEITIKSAGANHAL